MKNIENKIEFFKRKYPSIQLWPKEFLFVTKSILKEDHCKLLVFGLGYDTQLWKEINAEGRTAFIEDDEGWFGEISTLFPDTEAHLVKYNLFHSQWKDVLDKPEKLYVELPKEIMDTEWDVIFVDAPRGTSFSNSKKNCSWENEFYLYVI